MRWWIALCLLLISQPALAWKPLVKQRPASGGVTCLVLPSEGDLMIAREVLGRGEPALDIVHVGFDNQPGSFSHLNIDNVHYFRASSNNIDYWLDPEIVGALLNGRMAWIEWTDWPSDTKQQEIDLTGIKHAYDECVKATSP